MNADDVIAKIKECRQELEAVNRELDRRERERAWNAGAALDNHCQCCGRRIATFSALCRACGELS